MLSIFLLNPTVASTQLAHIRGSDPVLGLTPPIVPRHCGLGVPAASGGQLDQAAWDSTGGRHDHLSRLAESWFRS